MKRVGFLLGIVCLVALFNLFLAETNATASADVPVKGMVTLVDIGADQCIPCKMMAPILKELEEEYKGRAAIVFIDVWKNKEEGKRFGIRSIPTQIFYDKSGKEIFRHEGFFDKKQIVAVLKEAGVEPQASKP